MRLLELFVFVCTCSGVGAARAQEAERGAGADSVCLVPGDPDRHDPIMIGVAAPVDPRHAPRPTNDAERLVFRQLYQTLVRMDAAGNLRPELADEWHSLDERTWIFHIREDARFWDGTPVWAEDVRDAWLSDRTVDVGSDAARPQSLIEAVGLHQKELRTLQVILRESSVDLPAAFSHPSLAVCRADTTSRWPLGSGPYRIGREDAMGQTTRLQLVAAGSSGDGFGDTLATGSASRRSECIVLVHPSADPRDLATAGADLLLIRERGLLGYFDNLPDYQRVALPWDRAYALVAARLCPEVLGQDDRDSLALPETRLPAITAALRGELARSVVLSDARGLDWGDLPAASPRAGLGPNGTSPVGAAAFLPSPMPSATPPPRPSPPSDPPPVPSQARILFLDGDVDAGRMAGRLAVLMTWDREQVAAAYGVPLADLLHTLRAGADSPPPIAPGLSPAAFWESYDRGADTAYIVALERQSDVEILPPCSQPLVLTRAHLIYRRGLACIEVDADGTPLLSRAGWLTEDGPQ